MNYTGSKFKLLEQILPECDYTKPYFVDLFCGGGSIYTNVADKYDKLIANDVIKDLVGIHQSLLDGDSIIEETKSIKRINRQEEKSKATKNEKEKGIIQMRSKGNQERSKAKSKTRNKIQREIESENPIKTRIIRNKTDKTNKSQ